MVQFGNYLKTYRHNSWRAHYLGYERLKTLLYKLQSAVEATVDKPARETEIEEGNAFHQQLLVDLNTINEFFLRKREELRTRTERAKKNVTHWKLLEGEFPGGEHRRCAEIARLTNSKKKGEGAESSVSSSSSSGDEDDETTDEESEDDADEVLMMSRGGADARTRNCTEVLEDYLLSEEWHRRRRAIMHEIKNVFTELELLRDFSSLNYTGFSMILKKHDKLLPDYACKSEFIKARVNVQEVFGFHDDIMHLKQELIMLFADEFLNGNRMDADIALGSHLAKAASQCSKSNAVKGRARDKVQRSMVYATSQSMSVFNEDQLWWVEKETRDARKSGKYKRSEELWRKARISLMAVQSFKKDTASQRYWTIVFALVMVMLGGLAQSMSLEYVVRHYSGAGPTISFFQFLFVAAEGFRNYIEWSDDSVVGVTLTKRAVPLLHHCTFLICSWLAAVLAAMALDFHVSIATSMIIKSLSLLINMTMGFLLLGKRYSTGQVCSVLVLTAGVVLHTLLSLPSGNADGGAWSDRDMSTYLIGLTLLGCSLLCTGMIGVVQDITFRKYGKHWREMMFYAHFLGLFLFALLGADIIEHVELWTRESPVVWLYVGLSTLAQFMCIKGIYQFISLTSSLTGTLVLTLRKFLLVVVSVIVFDSEFTWSQWACVGLVLFGTILYAFTSQTAQQTEMEQMSKQRKAIKRSSSMKFKAQ